MCLICDRIKMVRNGTNPYSVKELEEMKNKLHIELKKFL